MFRKILCASTMGVALLAGSAMLSPPEASAQYYGYYGYRPYTTYYAPYYYRGPATGYYAPYYSPGYRYGYQAYVPGQPVRNYFRWRY